MIPLNYFMIKDDTLTFTLKPMKVNTLLDTIPFEMLFCEYGFIIPTSEAALGLLDYFELGVYSAENVSKGLSAALFTPAGRVYQYYTIPTYGVRRRRLPLGKGAFAVRSPESYVEDIVTAGHLLYDDPQKVAESLDGFFVTPPHRYMTLTKDQLLAMLAERKITKEPPAMHYIGDEDKVMGREARQFGG